MIGAALGAASLESHGTQKKKGRAYFKTEEAP